MKCFKPKNPDMEFRTFREEYRKTLLRERRLRKLVRQLANLISREMKREECEEVPTIRF
jgi:hypothetical protein